MPGKLKLLKNRLVCSSGCASDDRGESSGQEGPLTPLIPPSENGDRASSASGLQSSEQREELLSPDSSEDQEAIVTDSGPDFSRYVPYVPWVHIMSCLNERDRFAVASTCRQLYAVSQDPSLWQTFEMLLGRVGNQQWNQKNKMKLQATEKAALRTSCRHVKKVVIWMEDVHHLKFNWGSLKALTDATREWQLTSVHLNGYKHSMSMTQEPQRLPSKIRQLFVNFLTSEGASGLKSLQVKVWPWLDRDGGSTILSILEGATFCDSLTDLNLIMVTHFYGHDLNPLPEDWLAVASVVRKFRALQKLTISAPYLCDDLLSALSEGQHCPLQELQIWEGDFQQKVMAWPGFLSHCPAVEVSLLVRKLLACSSLQAALLSTVPLVRCYLGSHVNVEDQKKVVLLLPAYAAQLTSLDVRCSDQSLTDSSVHLLEMVTRCRRLRNIAFFGQVRGETIFSLAALKRGWGTFLFLKDHITFPDCDSPRTHECRVNFLAHNVSRMLGFAWLPSRLTTTVVLPLSAVQACAERVVGLRVLPAYKNPV